MKSTRRNRKYEAYLSSNTEWNEKVYIGIDSMKLIGNWAKIGIFQCVFVNQDSERAWAIEREAFNPNRSINTNRYLVPSRRTTARGSLSAVFLNSFFSRRAAEPPEIAYVREEN